MSNSKHAQDSRKSNFSQTCNLLSQYMKEKGNLRNLGLDKALGKSADSISDLNCIGKPETAPQTMNLLNKMENENSKAKQMTIFYGGQVLVFDDFPAEKVNEIVQSAVNNNGGFAGQYSEGCSTSKNPQAIGGSDMPIARRASLNRFLEKRKDRRAPYELQNQSLSAPKRERKEEFDLNL